VNQPAKDIHRAIAELADRGERFALALVLEAEGSTPVGVGAKAAIEASGAIHGTVGGGSVEAEAQRRAIEAIATGRPLVFDFPLCGAAVGDASPICGGRMRLLVDPTAALHRAAYAAAAAARERREHGVLLTTIWGREAWDVDARFLAESEIPSCLGWPGSEAIPAALKAEKPVMSCVGPAEEGQPIEFLVEPLIPRPVLLIVGGGHVGQAVAVQGDLAGFEIVVVDDRPEFTKPELFPAGAALRCGRVGEEVAGFPFAADTYAVIVTRGHQHDAEALAACLRRPAAYVGMIGSRRKVALMREEFLRSERATAEEFDEVYAPIGLDLGAATVPEIATSIVAQLIAVRRTGRAPRMPTA